MRGPLARPPGQSWPDPQEAERGTNANDHRSFNWGRGRRDERAGRHRFFLLPAPGDAGPHPAVAHRSFLEMTNEGAALRHGAAIISPAGSSWAVPRVRRGGADARLTWRQNIPHHRNRCSTSRSSFRPRGIAGFQSSVSSIRPRGTPELSAREYASSIFETRPRDDVGAKAAASAGRRARRAAD